MQKAGAEKREKACFEHCRISALVNSQYNCMHYFKLRRNTLPFPIYMNVTIRECDIAANDNLSGSTSNRTAKIKHFRKGEPTINHLNVRTQSSLYWTSSTTGSDTIQGGTNMSCVSPQTVPSSMFDVKTFTVELLRRLWKSMFRCSSDSTSYVVRVSSIPGKVNECIADTVQTCICYALPYMALLLAVY